MSKFARIFGIETEYGLSITGDDAHDIDVRQVAMEMFRPVISRSRATNTYLANGSRLYLDVGTHPEYATAEAINPYEATVQDMAGERVIARLGKQAQISLRSKYGQHCNIHIFKNNTDSQQHSFGCHENYLVRRFVPLKVIEHELLGFLITRCLWAGAGSYGSQWQISQRAPYLDDTISSATTHARPMVNTRDEPHANADEYRRLHVIIGDSNRSSRVTWLKMMTTHLMLCMIEESLRTHGNSPLEGLTLSHPVEALQAVSTSPNGTVQLALEHEHKQFGDSISALALQRYCYEQVQDFIEHHREELLEDLQGDDIDLAMQYWNDALHALQYLPERTPCMNLIEYWSPLTNNTAVMSATQWVDWLAKYQILQAYYRRRTSASSQCDSHSFADNTAIGECDYIDNIMLQLDFSYHDIVQQSPFQALLRAGRMDVIADDQTIQHAMQTPPSHTRAQVRGLFVQEALQAGVHWNADWTHLSVQNPPIQCELLDPFQDVPSEEVLALLQRMRNNPVDNPMV